MKVLIGSNLTEPSPGTRTLFQFLYQQHQDFGLEANATETTVQPRDERTLFRLVLSEASKKQLSVPTTDLDALWIEVCNSRLHPETSTSDLISSLVEITNAHLNMFNLVDRVTVARRLLVEFDSNHALKQSFYDAHYLVVSRFLPWFEYSILRLLVLFPVPNIQFCFAENFESNFFCLRLCIPTLSVQYKKCPVKDVLLSYLGLAVNIKDSLRLLRCMNRPRRGLDSATFTALRHVAAQDKLSAGQAAISFVGRRQLGGSDYAPTASHPLHRWSAGLEHLVECLTKCQDALSGALDDTALTMVSESNQMCLGDACSAVDLCLLTASRFLRKPLTSTLTVTEDSIDNQQFTDAKIKQAVSSLRTRLKQLASTDYAASLCCETPGRSLVSGGSLRGRAANKLVRLLLVIEGECSTVLPQADVSIGVSRSPDAPSLITPRTPSNRTPIPRTPTTVGHDERLVQMFTSPDTPSETTPIAKRKKEAEENKENFVPLAALPEFDEAVSMPERPVFSRYQTNLDWADTRYSPVPKVRIDSSLWNPDELYAQSLPAWTDENARDVNHSTQRSTCDSQTASKPTTPRKSSTRSPTKFPRTLFTDQPDAISTGKSGSTESLGSTTSNKRKLGPTHKLKATKSNRKPGAKNALTSIGANQRRLTDFFSA